MRWRHLSAFVALLWGSSPFTHAQTSSSVLPPDNRPAAVPPEFIITPNGYFHPSCVIEIGDHERVTATDDILAPDGSRRSLARCNFPHYTKHGTKVDPLFPLPPTVNSWVADVQGAPGAISWIAAYWTVPSAPRTASGQIVYFFPGVEPLATQDTILQPVLGWNQYNTGTGWTIASWNCCRNGNNLHSPFVPVSSGTSVYGYIWGTNCNTQSGVCSSWQILTSQAGGNQSTLNTDSYGEVLNWTFSGVLEAYNISSCDQYPPNNTLSFTGVAVHDVSGNPIQPAWLDDLLATSPACSTTVQHTGTTATVNWCAPLSPSCAGNCGMTLSDGCGGSVTCPPCAGCPSGYTDCGDGVCVKYPQVCK